MLKKSKKKLLVKDKNVGLCLLMNDPNAMNRMVTLFYEYTKDDLCKNYFFLPHVMLNIL